MSITKNAMAVQSDHESGFFEDDEVEIIHEEIVNPATFIPRPQPQQNKGMCIFATFCCFKWWEPSRI